MLRGIGRLRAKDLLGAALDLDFTSESVDSRITYSGGANGTRVNSAGVIVAATTPRFDYDPVTLAAKGRMGEEERTNLLLRSGEIENAVWSNNGTTKTGGSGDAPDGANAATLVSANGASSAHYVGGSDGVGAKTISVFAQAGTQALLQIATGGTAVPYANFELSGDGTATAFGVGTTASIHLFGNGWYRCVLSTTNASVVDVRFAFITSMAAARLESSTLATNLYLWGAQSEAGAFATSYIPTTSATVTRTADSAVMTGTNFSDWFNNTQGSFVVQFDVGAVSGTRPILSLDDNTANQQIRLYTSGTSLKLTVTDGGVTQADLTLGTVAANTSYKAAFAFAANDFAAVLSGGTVQTDVAGTVPTVDRMRIGSDQAGNYQNGRNARTTAHRTRLPNATLQALTA